MSKAVLLILETMKTKMTIRIPIMTELRKVLIPTKNMMTIL